MERRSCSKRLVRTLRQNPCSKHDGLGLAQTKEYSQPRAASSLPAVVARGLKRHKAVVAFVARDKPQLVPGSDAYRKEVWQCMASKNAYTDVTHPMSEHIDVDRKKAPGFLESKYVVGPLTRVRVIKRCQPLVEAVLVQACLV
jgi:hypothetical protein